MFVKLSIRNLGPIENIETIVKPITCVVGKNAVGKSLLLMTMYTLASTLPDFSKWFETTYRDIESLYEDLTTSVKEEANNRVAQILAKYTKNLIQGLELAIKEPLRQRLETLLGAPDLVPREILVLDTETDLGYKMRYNEEKELEFRFVCHDVNVTIERALYHNDSLSIIGEVTWCKSSEHLELRGIRSARDVSISLAGYVLPRILASLAPLSLGAWGNLQYFACDARAGVLRMLPLAIQSTLLASYTQKAYMPAVVSEFLSILTNKDLNKAVEHVRNSAKEFLNEIGIRDIFLEEITPGFYKPVIVDRWGKKIGIEYVSSGIRESILVPLALTVAEGVAVFVEEIEAHLHPRALHKLIKYLVKEVIERYSFLVFTTHNPITLSSLNNVLLELERKKPLIHELFTVLYLVDEEHGVRGVEVPVSEDGFDESALGKIYEELLEERARLEKELEKGALHESKDSQ